MKKSLIALAALATVATVAQAQSSVSVYGIIDTGYMRSTNVNSNGESVSGISNGGLSTSRLGFRGTEDLGSGLKANFVLESEFLADNGSQNSTAEALFARRSTVGLEGNFGRVDLGRIDTGSYAMQAKFDPFGANNIGGIIATGQVGQVRVENSVTYTTPTYAGLSVTLQTGTRTSTSSNTVSSPATSTATFGEVAGQPNGNRNNTLAVNYTQGKLELGAYYADSKDAAAIKLHENFGGFARYDFGVARVTTGLIDVNYKNKASGTSTTAWASGDTVETRKAFIGVNVPVSANLTVSGLVEKIQYKRYTSSDREPTIYSLLGQYNLSKRTALYAVYSQVNQDNGSAQTNVSTTKLAEMATAIADKSKVSYGVGIRHSF